MNILLYDMGAYSQKDLISELRKAGHKCKNILYKPKDIYHDPFFERRFSQYIKEGNYDFVMSMNYFPMVARVCHSYNLKYISWCYDAPINADIIEEYQYPNAYIFHFDRVEVQKLLSRGAINVYHMPLAVIPHKYDNLRISASDRKIYSAEISFVGQFYENHLKTIMLSLNEYDNGFIDALVQTQLQVYGYNFIDQIIDESFVTRMNQSFKEQGFSNTLSKRGLEQGIAKEITHIERLVLCYLLGKNHEVKFYSAENPVSLSHLTYCGTAFYHTQMPIIFRLSKINLNPTLKSISSGIPLRCFDILNSGGLLFSNYQPELAEFFINEEDVVMYESIEDAIARADYYLNNEAIRAEIAKRGKQKASELFSYKSQLQEIFDISGII